jgi:thiamine-monophosphate kinase
MKPAGLGEFGRIRRFFAPLAGPGGLGLVDDAALVECRPGHRLVVTVDQAIEGVHYLLGDPPDLVAKKLLRRNLSDLAAMGATPRHYLLTVALPPSVELGDIAEGKEIRRSGAKPGDRVWVSGTIGDAFLGLAVLRGDYPKLAAADRAALAARFQLPEPRCALGPRLVGIVHALIDVSDGLVADLGHICETSGVAATVDLARLPLSPAAQLIVTADAALRLRLATGGDDYELLFAAPPEAAGTVASLAAELSVPIAEIGAIVPGFGVRLLDAAGAEIPVGATGWRHF